MPFHHSEPLRYYSFSILDPQPVHQGIFTRQGGVSPQPWASLNTGGLNGDEREHVVENRRRIFSEFQLPVESIFDVWQVHSADVVTAVAPRPLDEPHQKADAILTNRPGITLFMRFGDCVPVYFYDPKKCVIGLAHAGWPGTVAKVVEKTVAALWKNFRSDPADILAGIGPSICMDHYEIKEDVIVKVRASLGRDADQVLAAKSERTYLDLWQSNRLQLLHAGVASEHIEMSRICTAENPADWYSHRAEHGKTGRFGALLALK